MTQAPVSLCPPTSERLCGAGVTPEREPFAAELAAIVDLVRETRGHGVESDQSELAGRYQVEALEGLAVHGAAC